MADLIIVTCDLVWRYRQAIVRDIVRRTARTLALTPGSDACALLLVRS